MKLGFKGLKINTCHFEGLGPDTTYDNLEFRLGYGARYEGAPRMFVILFDVGLYPDERAALRVQAEALFEGSDDLPPDFIEGPFARINAPAIAFPYLRAFIANFLVGAGYPPIHLPSVNFQALAEGQS